MARLRWRRAYVVLAACSLALCSAIPRHALPVCVEACSEEVRGLTPRIPMLCQSMQTFLQQSPGAGARRRHTRTPRLITAEILSRMHTLVPPVLLARWRSALRRRRVPTG